MILDLVFGGNVKKRTLALGLFAMVSASGTAAQNSFEEDMFQTSAGELKITFIGHGTLMFTFGDMVIHVDPWSRAADYDGMPKADLVLVTHEHGDHLDAAAIETLTKENTSLVLTPLCAEQLERGTVIRNGERRTIAGVTVEAVPAYNLKNLRRDGSPFHPKGVGNGYVLTFGDMRVYVAGDTENTTEMKALTEIDVAFLPMNLPYTMDPEMVADAARAFKPRILYPYHFGETDVSQLQRLLAGEPEIEVRVRAMS
jgi:L-ascorbate metabolism protein UlaG (beta-lactamase superfamily)